MTTPKRRKAHPDRPLHEIFTDQFENRPKTSLGDIALHVSAQTGLRVTDQTIGTYHKGDVKVRPNLVIIAAIADFYGLKAAELPADIVALLENAAGVLTGLVGRGTPPGTRTRNLQSAGLAA